MLSEFLRAARDGDLSKVQYCLAEGNARIAERDRFAVPRCCSPLNGATLRP
jgi:hypothetical protein